MHQTSIHFDLIENGLFSPKGSDIEKWLLWKESEERCLYTNQEIQFKDLFGSNTKFDTEHIIPYSVSLDNGFMNKTLGEKQFNIDKGNRIPFDALHMLLAMPRLRGGVVVHLDLCRGLSQQSGWHLVEKAVGIF